MNPKKKAITALAAAAVAGSAVVGLGAGTAQADPKFPVPPVPPVPAPPIPHVPHLDAAVVQHPHGPEVNVPPVHVPRAPEVNVPPVHVPVPGIGHLPKVVDVDDFFGLPGAHLPPGQLMNARTINGRANPFYGIPPGHLKNMPTVEGYGDNPFFDKIPGHWVAPAEFLPDVDDFFGRPGDLTPVRLRAEVTINGIRNPFFGIPAEQLVKMPTVQGYVNPFFDGLPGHWEIT